MIFVEYSGRLGNNLFQFALGSVLAWIARVPLRAQPIPGFNGTRLLLASDMIQSRVPDSDAVVPFQHGQAWPKGFRIGYLADQAQYRDVIIAGHPHNYCFFEHHKRFLADILQPENLAHSFDLQSGDLVVNVRIGDFFHPSMDRFNYPLESLGATVLAADKIKPIERLVIVTDEPTHPFIEKLQQLFVLGQRKAVVVHQDALFDYNTLFCAERLIIPPSSFAWWPAFIGNAKEVWMPVEKGSWKQANGFDLSIMEPRIRFF